MDCRYTALIWLVGAVITSAAEPVNPLDGSAFRYSGPSAGETAGRVTWEPVEEMPFPEAWRLETVSLPSDPAAATEWSMQFKATATSPVVRGDLLYARFWMRCVESAEGECALRLVVERNSDPYTKSYSQIWTAGREWREVKLAFRAVEDRGARQWTVGFWLGQQVQKAEVGGFELLNHGPDATPESVGVDPLYEGAADDAPWRAAAYERIERLRKAPLKVTVVDEEGRPLAGAKVKLRQVRHEFGWGTAVAAHRLLGVSEDSERYRAFVLDNFNFAVLENDLKWPQWEQNRQRALDAIAWLHEHGVVQIRGHNLVWPGWRWLPGDLPSLASQPEMLRERIRAHIESIVTATRGQLVHWDVLNEPYSNRDLQKILGDAAMAEWFQEARRHDERPRLYINDFNILSAGGNDLAHRNHYLRTIRTLLDQQAPVEGVGMQGHFDSPTPPEQILRILDRFAEFGLPISITEYDFKTTDEELQARFFRDLLLAFFSHPAAESFLMWGFWEASHWIPEGAMIRKDWTEKPSFAVWREMVYKLWWTDAEAEASEEGACEFSGFKGVHRLEVEHEGRTAAREVALGAGGAEVQVVLAPETQAASRSVRTGRQ